MKSIDIQEQKRYNRKELKEKFNTDEERTISIIKKLKELNILKTVKHTDKQLEMRDLLDEDIEIVDEEEGSSDHLYVFTFVGIILVNRLVIRCYPKYLEDIENDKEIDEKLRVIIKVLQIYNRRKEQIVNLYINKDKNKGFNLLAATVYLMNDYYENGIYTNEQKTIETNGNGEIDWNKTIDKTYPVIKDGKPYYFELQTRKRIIDDYDFFKRLHEIILTKCSKDIKEADLMNILGLSELYLSDGDLDQLGEKDYILKRLNDEKHEQYNTRKLELLSVMEAYISHEGTIQNIDNFSVFGTNSFNLVWEKVCGQVLRNQLYTPIKDLKLPQKGRKEYGDCDDELISIIEKPFWKNNDNIGKPSEATLIPDMIAVGEVAGEFEFDIFDAKYYNTFIDANGAKGQPGVESIVKQYVYQMAFRDFIEKSGIDQNKVNNCFIMPMDGIGEDNYVKKEGSVEMSMFNIDNNIKVRKIQANRIFKYYIQGIKMNIEEMLLSDD